MWNWLRALRGKPRARALIADADWDAARCVVRLLEGRGSEELAALRELVAWFLGRFAFSGTHDLVVTTHMRLVVAIQACLPLLHLPRAWLGHWHEVILYPGQFRVRRHAHEDDSEVVTEWDDELAGESWSHGPVILSWADVEQDLADPFEGFNVVIHEIAHKIDMADGESDGMPPLRDAARRREWRATMQAAYDALAAQVERDEETVIDAYAAESPDEFFAVATEYYFSAPDVLAQHYAGVHAQFAQLYGPVPMPVPALDVAGR